MFYEQSNHKVCCQRIETTTGNGVPDFMVILPFGIYLIESKFETTKIRSEQAAFQIRTNSSAKNDVQRCFTLSAYPKTKRLVVTTFNTSSITEDGIVPATEVTYSLDAAGFKQFYLTLSDNGSANTSDTKRLYTASTATCVD
jgi:hypothetical protein